MVTPLRKAATYMYSHFRDLGWYVANSWQIWQLRGSTWEIRDPYGSTWRLLESGEKFQMFKILPRKISPIYCHVSYVAVTRIPSIVLRNTWHYVIIRRQNFLFLNLSCVAHMRRLYAKVWPRHKDKTICKIHFREEQNVPSAENKTTVSVWHLHYHICPVDISTRDWIFKLCTCPSF